MDDQCANEYDVKFNLKKIHNFWFINAGGKLHRLSILNNANSVHMEENVIFADESMYQVILNENGKIEIDKIEDLCKSIDQEEVQPDIEQQSTEDEYDSDCNSTGDIQDAKDTSKYSDAFLETGQEEYTSEEDEPGSDKQIEKCSEDLVTEGESDMNMTMLVTALYDFNARLDDEISFNAGDVFIAIRRNLNDSNVWIKATHQGSGQIGFIPRNYVATGFKQFYLKDWWHDLNKREAESQLSAPHFEQGTFIIRSSSDRMSLVVSVKDSEMGADIVTIRHYRINCTKEGEFYLSKQRLFADMTALIQFCQNCSKNDLCCRLGEQLFKTIPDMPFRDLESPRKLMTIRQNLCQDISTGAWRNRDVTIKQYMQLEIKNFLTEIDILKRLEHDNVIKLLAVFTKEKPFLMVFDMTAIDILTYHLRQDRGKTIKHDQLLDMAIQIAKGMTYLCTEDIVHRDLRTGNILVGRRNKLKIAGFEKAKRLQNGVYVPPDVIEQIAVKWAAPEVFSEGIFTTHSDVWSFGVLLNEMITFGKMPYPGMSNSETKSKVQEGYRMKIPDDGPILCPRESYDIMFHCWDKIPTNRPTFLNIVVLLNNYANPKKNKKEKDAKNACVCM